VGCSQRILLFQVVFTIIPESAVTLNIEEEGSSFESLICDTVDIGDYDTPCCSEEYVVSFTRRYMIQEQNLRLPNEKPIHNTPGQCFKSKLDPESADLVITAVDRRGSCSRCKGPRGGRDNDNIDAYFGVALPMKQKKRQQ
jgi:hypothetical protein